MPGDFLEQVPVARPAGLVIKPPSIMFDFEHVATFIFNKIRHVLRVAGLLFLLNLHEQFSHSDDFGDFADK